MQLSNLLTILAVATTAAALPPIRLVGRAGPTCSLSEKPMCCGGLLGLCTENPPEGGCRREPYCCKTGHSSGFINIDLLNCAIVVSD